MPTHLTASANADSIPFLLAEDDDGHAELIERNFRRAGIANKIIRVVDGQEALDRVYGIGKYATAGPLKLFLLILDVNMPKVDGIEVLKQIKRNPATRATPVIVLSTTDDPREINKCYELGCNVYITKPISYETFAETVKRLGLFLEVMRVPER